MSNKMANTFIASPCYQLTYLTADDLRLAASILYRAYLDDPFFHAILSTDETRYKQQLRCLIRHELTHLWQQEQALVGLFDGERLLGILCVTNAADDFAQKRSWLWRLKMAWHIGRRGMRQYVQKEQQIQTHLPKHNVGVIEFFAVNPSVQHQGMGQQLIHALTHWCDAQPQLEGLALFVADEQFNANYYQQGFALLSKRLMGLSSALLFYPSKVV